LDDDGEFPPVAPKSAIQSGWTWNAQIIQCKLKNKKKQTKYLLLKYLRMTYSSNCSYVSVYLSCNVPLYVIGF
jgi:hypothetical protein